MPTPNIVSLSSMTGHTALCRPSTTLAAAGVENPPGSGQSLRLTALLVANIASSGADISIAIQRGAAQSFLAKSVSVPKQSSITLLDRSTPIYLEEGDSLIARASANGAIDLTIAYEVIS